MADNKWSERKEEPPREKLKAISQEERLRKWKVNFKNLLGNPSKRKVNPCKKNINCQLDIKLVQFTEEELDTTGKKLKAVKQQALRKFLKKYGR